MTSIQFYHSLIEKDDQEFWNDYENHLYGSDFDDDLDNKIFSWE